MPRLLVLAGLLACLGCVTPAAPGSGESHAVIGAAAVAPHTPTDWRELRSEHFTLTTDFDEASARKLIARLERLRHALFYDAWGITKDEGDRTHAIIFQNHGEFSELVDENLGGFANSGADHEIVSFGRKLEEQTIFAHELTHLISARYLIEPPLWFNEGLACFFETINLDYGGDENLVEVGDINVNMVRELKFHGRMPIEKVFARDWRHFDPDAPDLANFYSTSWLLVHYLYNTHRDGFRAYQLTLARGTPADVAWKSAFPDIDVAKLDDALTLYLKYGRFTVFQLPLPPEPPHQISAVELSDPDVHALRAGLMLRSPGHRTRAERVAAAKAELAPAIAAAPDDPRVIAVEDHWLKQAERLPLWRRAVAAHPDSALAWHELAEALPESDGVELLNALEKAVQLDPTDAENLNSWAWQLLVLNRPAEALEPAMRAAKANPDPAILDTLARALAENHRCAEAIPLQQRAIQSAAPEARGRIRDLIEDLARLQTRCDTEAKAKP